MSFVHPIPKNEAEGPHGLIVTNAAGAVSGLCACGEAFRTEAVDGVGDLRSRHLAHRLRAGVQTAPADASTGV